MIQLLLSIYTTFINTLMCSCFKYSNNIVMTNIVRMLIVDRRNSPIQYSNHD